MFDGLIKGLNEWRDKVRRGQADYGTPVEGLKAIDLYTLRITLTRPLFSVFTLALYACDNGGGKGGCQSLWSTDCQPPCRNRPLSAGSLGEEFGSETEKKQEFS